MSSITLIVVIYYKETGCWTEVLGVALSLDIPKVGRGSLGLRVEKQDRF